MDQGLAKGIQEGASPLLAWWGWAVEAMGLGFIRMGAGRALLGVFWVVVVYHMSHWSNIIEVLGQDDSVFPLSVKRPAQAFPINVFVGGPSPFVLVTQVFLVEGLCASPSKFSLEFVGDGAML